MPGFITGRMRFFYIHEIKAIEFYNFFNIIILSLTNDHQFRYSILVSFRNLYLFSIFDCTMILRRILTGNFREAGFEKKKDNTESQYSLLP